MVKSRCWTWVAGTANWRASGCDAGNAALIRGWISVCPLLEVARHGWEDAPATFIRADLSATDWDKRMLAPTRQRFDVVTAFAVLHHIPGATLRSCILEKVHNLLSPGGKFIHSEWQFLNSEKLKIRVQPWHEVGLTDKDVEPGDYLLDWRSGGRGLRYVHQFEEAELVGPGGAEWVPGTLAILFRRGKWSIGFVPNMGVACEDERRNRQQLAAAIHRHTA